MKENVDTLVNLLIENGFVDEKKRMLLRSTIRSWATDITQEMISKTNEMRALLSDEQGRILGPVLPKREFHPYVLVLGQTNTRCAECGRDGAHPVHRKSD